MVPKFAEFASLTLLLALYAAVVGQSITPQSGRNLPGTVTGRVTADGKGLSNAIVSLSRRGDGSAGIESKADTAGNYRLTGVPPGRYVILAFLPGYLNQKDAWSKEFTIASGETRNGVDIELTRGGVITGRVTDAEGEPVAEEPVALIFAGIRIPPSAMMDDPIVFTDDRGVYRFFGLAPGKYKVGAGPELVGYLIAEGLNGIITPGGPRRMIGRAAQRRIFFPNSPDESKARIIEVKPGSEIPDLDIRLEAQPRLFSVSGKIIDGETGKPIPDTSFSIALYEGDKQVVMITGPTRSNRNGEFTIDKLPPGRSGQFTETNRNKVREADGETVTQH
jgi:hypothetical protein